MLAAEAGPDPWISPARLVCHREEKTMSSRHLTRVAPLLL
jgi:hypothetical protein